MSKVKEDKTALFTHYWQLLGDPSIVFEREYRFDSSLGRKHRFDHALPSRRLAIEIDGGQFQPLGGRHSRDSDREKMNLAAMLGWRVMHYSPQMIKRDPQGMIEQVISALDFDQ